MKKKLLPEIRKGEIENKRILEDQLQEYVFSSL